jgi:hypothetical protein
MTGWKFEQKGFIRAGCMLYTRLVKEMARLGMVHNGSRGQTQRQVARGPKDRLEWPPLLHLSLRHFKHPVPTGHLPTALTLDSPLILENKH